MNKIISTILVVLFLAGCSDNQPLTPAQFTKEYAEALQKAHPGAKIKIKAPLELQFTGTSGTELTAFLDNCFKQYTADPKNKTAIIAQYVDAFSEEPSFTDDKIDLARIVPVVKDRDWPEEIKNGIAAAGGKDWPDYAYDTLNSELLIFYVEDSEKKLRYLNAKDIGNLPIKRDELKSLAVENLRRILAGKISKRGGNGKYMVTAGGNFEASLILLDELWTKEIFPVDGDIVIVVPSRDVLLITGSKNKEDLAALKAYAEKIVAETSYRLTSDLFVYRNGKFEKFHDE